MKMHMPVKFSGTLELNKKLDEETFALLTGLHITTRFARIGLDKEKYGVEGEFYIPYIPEEWDELKRNYHIVEPKRPPHTQPSFVCHWQPTQTKSVLQWDDEWSGDLLPDIQWIEYLIDNVLSPRKYTLNGQATWQSADKITCGKVIVSNNKLRVKVGEIKYRSPRADDWT